MSLDKIEIPIFLLVKFTAFPENT